MIYSLRHSKHPSKNSFVRKILLSEFLKVFPEPAQTITVTKPDRAPPRMLTDTCDGLYPVFTGKYLRRVLEESVEQASLKATKPW